MDRRPKDRPPLIEAGIVPCMCSGKPCLAKTRKCCERCAYGLSQDGKPSRTYYCSEICQGLDWNKHQELCIYANHRRAIYRGGRLLQDLYYASRLSAYNLALHGVGKNPDSGKIELYLGEDTGEEPLTEFPNKNSSNYDVDVMRAVLGSADIGIGSELMGYLVYKILIGEYTKTGTSSYHYFVLPYANQSFQVYVSRSMKSC